MHDAGRPQNNATEQQYLRVVVSFLPRSDRSVDGASWPLVIYNWQRFRGIAESSRDEKTERFIRAACTWHDRHLLRVHARNIVCLALQNKNTMLWAHSNLSKSNLSLACSVYYLVFAHPPVDKFYNKTWQLAHRPRMLLNCWLVLKINLGQQIPCGVLKEHGP